MPCTHHPRLEIDVTVVVEVGIVPLGVFIVGHTILDDANHVFRIQHVGILEVTHSAYFVAYTIPLATTVKQLTIDEFRKFIANVVVHLDFIIHLENKEKTCPSEEIKNLCS